MTPRAASPCRDQDEASPVSSTITVPRSFVTQPRFLYSLIFVWISLVGGRFLAPFLRHSCQLKDAEIGILLASQKFCALLASGPGGAWADARQRRYPKNGRAQVLGLGVLLGTVAFVLHSAASSFWWHWILQCLYALSTCFVFPVLDGMTLAYLKEANLDQNQYGKERLYGAITWAVTNVAVAPLLDTFGFPILYPLGSLVCLGTLVGLLLYVRGHDHDSRQLLKQKSQLVSTDEVDNDCLKNEKVDEEVFQDDSNYENDDSDANANETTISWMKLLPMLFETPFGIAFISAVVCLSSGQAIVDSLSFLYFENLGSSFTTMGFMVCLTVAFEIPIFHVAPKLLDSLGAGGLLLLASLCYILRTLGYSFLPVGHATWVLFLEPLHGVTYACAQTATVHFVGQLVPLPGYEASGQGLLSLMKGIGAMVGLLLGGWAQGTSARLLYRVASAVVFVGSSLFGISSWCCNIDDKRGSHEVLASQDSNNDSTEPRLELTAVTASSLEEVGAP